MKILTVIVPVYNTEKYIKRCLDSLDNKEINDKLEVLVVSDGSKDNAINIAKEYSKRLPDTFKIIEKENGGHGSTINKGLELATGKYFRVLDSDAWVDNVNFVEFVKRLEDQDADLVVTDYSKEFIYEGKSEKIVYKNLEPNKKYIFDKFDLNILNGEYFVMATSTYKTEVLRKSNLKLMEKTFYVDMQYNVVPIPYVNSFVYFDLDIYRYFIGRLDQSVNTASFVKNHLNHDKVVKYLIDYYSNLTDISDTKKEYIRIILKYILFTHYSIYCIYFKKKRQGYKLVKEFDKYLYNKNKELYDVSNISFIKIYRNLKFTPTLLVINRMKDSLIKIGRRMIRR
ncbi:MAG: glycosyltransferase family 2 protein [Bacilli bacterium]|nr:glycosyltransferase family 2 protein [Bacilli bacterium]